MRTGCCRCCWRRRDRWRARKPQAAPAPQPVADQAEPAELVVANRPITTLRATAFGASPAERVEVITDGLDALLRRGGPLVVSARPIAEGLAIQIDGKFVFRILDGDANQEAGETPAMAADAAVRNLQLALNEMREGRDSRAMLKATGYSVIATTVLAFLLWLVVRGYALVARRIRAFVELRSDRLAPSWSRQVVGRSGIADLAVVPVKLVAWAVALLLAYEWAALVLEFFPYTRPWGEGLFDNLLGTLGRLGRGFLDAVPGLLFVVLIFIATRFIVRVVRAFFDGVQAGRIDVGWVDETTARPTGKLFTAIIWLFALVAAYPYIPGSGSEAFKGIGVFVGLMLSIGASGVVNQAISGLMLMYTKALRPGEFVQVGDTEGTVTSVGFLTTRIETLRNVEVTLPNALPGRQRHAQFFTPGGERRHADHDVGHHRLRHAVATGARDAAAGGGAHLENSPGSAAAGAADGAAGFLCRVHAGRLRGGTEAQVRRAQRTARAHPGRLQRVWRADHVAQLRGGPGRQEVRAEGALVRGTRATCRAPGGRAACGPETVGHGADASREP